MNGNDPNVADVLPGLDKPEVVKLASTALVFAVVLAVVSPFTEDLVRPAARRLWRAISR